MVSHLRAEIAYISAAINSGRSFSAVYDYSEGRYIRVQGSVSDTNVDIYNVEMGHYVRGSLTGGKGLLFHSGEGYQVEIEVNQGRVYGYDHGSKTHFLGYINDTMINLYDYEQPVTPKEIAKNLGYARAYIHMRFCQL